MNSLNKCNNFVSAIDKEAWKEFVNQLIIEDSFGIEDFYETIDLGRFFDSANETLERQFNQIRKWREEGVYLIFRTAYETLPQFSQEWTTNSMHVFVFMPTNTSYVFEKLPFSWVTPKNDEELAKNFEKYSARVRAHISKLIKKMNEFDINEGYINFVFDNVPEESKAEYVAYLNKQLARNKKYYRSPEPGEKSRVWGDDVVSTINSLRTRKAPELNTYREERQKV